MESLKEYYAFISYKREDEKWAKWLQHKLEHYKLPSNLNGRTDLPREIRPVFLDTSELNPSNLPQQIHDALAASRHLIVICSPRSAQSEWVNLEIETFITMGKQDCIIPFIIEGCPFAKDPSEECFPPAIRNLPKDQELLGANINERGRDAAAIKTVAQMFGLRFDSLWKRHVREQKRKQAIIIATAVLFILSVMGVAAYIWRQNALLNKSQTELQIAYDNLTVANQKTEQERDIANQEKERAEQAEDSIRVQYGIIEQERDRANKERKHAEQERARAEQEKERAEMAEDSIRVQYAIIEQERDKTQQALWNMLEKQARYVAEKGLALIDEHDSYTARLLALEVLPDSLDNPNKPFIFEAEEMLREAMKKDEAVLRGHTDRVYSVGFSSDSKRIVSGSKDGTIRIWDAVTGKQIGESFFVGEEVYFAMFSKDDNYILAKTSNLYHEVFFGDNWDIWDVSTGKQIENKQEISYGNAWNLYLGNNQSNRKCVIFDGNHSFFGDLSRVNWDSWRWFWWKNIQKQTLIRKRYRVLQRTYNDDAFILDVTTGKIIGQPLKGHANDILVSSFSPDGKLIVSGSMDNTIRIWDAASGKQIGEPLKGHNSAVYSVAFSPDCKSIVSGSNDGTILIWDLTSRQIKHSPFFDKVFSVVFSPDGNSVVSGSGYSIRIWDASSGKQIKEPLIHTYAEDYSVAFSPDGKRIFSGSYNLHKITVRIWDATTCRQIGEPMSIYSNTLGYHSIDFSPDGKYIVSVSSDTVFLWDVINGKCLDTLIGHNGMVNAVAFSPNGERIVSGAKDGTVRIWNSAAGKLFRRQLIGHSDEVHTVSFSPDGKRIVSGSEDKTIRIWDVTTGRCLNTLKGHTDIVYSVVFSPDGKRIVSGSGDNTIRVWDAVTGSQIGEPLKGHTNIVLSVAFSPDGKRIVSGSADGTVGFWDVSPLQDLIDETRKRFKDRELTPEERRKYYLE